MTRRERIAAGACVAGTAVLLVLARASISEGRTSRPRASTPRNTELHGSPPLEAEPRAPSLSPSPHPVEVVPEGDPGYVRCGTTTCDLAREHCCQGSDASQCTPVTAHCPSATFAMACDEAADCSTGQKCCVTSERVECAERCVESPTSRFYQLCAFGSECPDGRRCAEEVSINRS